MAFNGWLMQRREMESSIYTLDTRGLSASFADASTDLVATESHVDTTSTDASVSHQVLISLAADTGGRAILNNNDLEAGISKAFEEFSNYYLLAWHPEVVEQGKPKFRQLRVSIKGRPDLNVLARRGFLSSSDRGPDFTMARGRARN